MTYDDLYYGIPAMITAIVSLIFSLSFHFAFSPREYREDNQRGSHRMGTVHAIFDALNQADILSGVVTAFKLLFSNSDSEYGYGFEASKPPQRQRRRDSDNVSMEPLRMEQYTGPTVYQREPAYQQGPSQQLMQDYEGYAGGGYARGGYARVDGGLSRDASPERPAMTPRDAL